MLRTDLSEKAALTNPNLKGALKHAPGRPASVKGAEQAATFPRCSCRTCHLPWLCLLPPGTALLSSKFTPRSDVSPSRTARLECPDSRPSQLLPCQCCHHTTCPVSSWTGSLLQTALAFELLHSPPHHRAWLQMST